MGGSFRRLFFLILVSLWASGCGGATFNGHVFQGNGMAFRVGPVPSDWRRIDVSHALLAYRDDRDMTTIALNGRCHKDGDDVPLSALTHHLFIEFTGRRVLSQTVLPMDGRAAMRTDIIAKLDGVPKHFIVYVLKKDGCVYDFMSITAIQASERDQPAFEAFVRGFATLG